MSAGYMTQKFYVDIGLGGSCQRAVKEEVVAQWSSYLPESQGRQCVTFLSELSVLTGGSTALDFSVGICTGMSGTLKRSPCWKRYTFTPDTTGGRTWTETSPCSNSKSLCLSATIFILCACRTGRQQPGQHQGLCCDLAWVLDLGAWHTFAGCSFMV